MVGRARMKLRQPRTNARLVGWLPVAGSAVAVALGLALAAGMVWQGPTGRVVETAVPLVVGLQAAFLLSPEDEPPLELLLACPRPLAWTLWERWAVMMVLQGSVALAGTFVSLVLLGNEGPALSMAEGLPPAVARWLAPCAWLAGVALLTTQLTRQGVFGALLATLMWSGMRVGGDALLSRWPFLWPLHVYLQPEGVAPAVYALNRTGLTLAGLALAALAAYLTRDEERVLGVRSVWEER